jgi:hypothetical protein
MAQFSSSTFGRYAGFWLIVTAAIELGLAAVFLAIGVFVPIVDWGMFLTAAILGITGIVLLVIGLRVRSSAAANAALLQTGLAGTAVVTGLAQTGMYLNENPQVAIDLRIDLPGREPYVATRKEFVPLILLGRLTSGAPLPVRVDRANPQRLVIDWSNVGLGGAAVDRAAAGGGATAGTLAAATGLDAATLARAIAGATVIAIPAADAAATAQPATPPVGSVPVTLPAGITNMGTGAPLVAEQFAQLRGWLRQTGVPGSARIDQAMDMGTFVGNDRLFTIQATLELAGKAPEKLPPLAALVAAEDVEKVREGYRVSVRVAPDNHQLIDFDW